MKPKFRSLIASFAPLSRTSLIVVASLGAASSAHAASQTWKDVATDGNWITATNWVGGAVPGATRTGNANNADVVTFNAVSNFSTIAIDANRFINSITFPAGAGAYTFTGGLLYLSQNGSINVAADVTNPQVFSNDWRPQTGSSTNGVYSFINNATSPAAKLTFNAPAVTFTNGNGRPTTLTLDGTNTGDNTISSNLTNATVSQAVNVMNKNGTGTWILSGANTFTYSTSGGNPTGGAGIAANGIRINAGTLVIANSAALGTDATANRLQTSVNDTGTLKLTGGITVDNGVSLNLNTGGTILSNGSNATNGRINLSTTASTVGTISTVGALDVFTIGNGANDLTGGAADTVINVSGLGTVFTTQSSTGYLGQWSIGSGTLKSGSVTNGLGVNGIVTFANGSTGKLQLGNSLGLTRLTTDVGTPTAGIVEAGVVGTQTLTLTTTVANEFPGTFRDGGGTLALLKTGVETLTLSGNSNTYSGGTTISTGTLLVTNTSGSATGTGAVALNSGTLAGTGSVSGAVTVASLATIAPGNGGIGTIGVGPLTLASGSKLGFDVSSAASMDRITTSGVLTINGGELTINGGASVLNTNGVYTVISGFSSIGGTGVGSLTLNPLNKDAIFKTYTFGQSGGSLTLTVADSGVVASYWNTNSDSNWSVGPWTTTAPNHVSDFALFGGGGTAITAPRTVTVDGAFTVGTLSFNNPSYAYTLADSLGANITLDNGATGSSVTDTAGSHFIQAPLTLTTNGATFSVVNIGDTLTTSGAISGVGGLTKIGNGTLALLGTNSYTGNTVITGGTISVNNANSLGDSASLTTIGAGTLLAKEDITSTRNFNLTDAASKISVDSTKTYTLSGVIGAGSGTLNKTGAGTLVLSGVNTYTGGTVISGGVLRISADSALGAIPGAPAPNLTLNDGTTLQAGGAVNLNVNRTLVFNGGTEIIDTQANTLTLSGASNGSGALSKIGTGTLTVVSGQGYTGNTFINQGTLQINVGGGLAGEINLATGTTFRLQSVGANNSFAGNNIILASGANVTFASNSTGNGYGGNVTGDETCIIQINSGASAFNFSAVNTKQLESFSGTVNVAAGSSMDCRGTTNNNGSTSATFNIDGFVSAKNGGNWTFGTLTGASTGNLGGAVTYNVGASSNDSTYYGIISSSSGTGLRKDGLGTLTLGGVNTYTGDTVVNAGTLNMAVGSQLLFRINAASASNKITGVGKLKLNGNFNLDLNNPAALANGNSWQLVATTLSSADEFPIYGTTFNIPGFTEVADVWTKNEGNVVWTFTEATGALTVTVNGYVPWATDNGLTAGVNDGPTDDPDLDGIANELEYVLGGNPLASSTSVLPVLVPDPTNFIFTFNRKDVSYNDVALVFQSSPDLAVWTDLAIPAQTAGTVTVTPGTPSDVITVTIPKAANTKLFGRLKAAR